MKITKLLAFVFFVFAILCFIVLTLMYRKLSFVDYPYLIGGIIFSLAGFLFLKIKSKGGTS